MGLYKDFVSQTRKPEGFLGKMMLNGMNSGHAKMAEWGMSHLPRANPEQVIDLGCGGGRNAGELLKRYPESQVTAVDYSDLSVQKAKEYNRAMIENGRIAVLRGDVSALPFPEGKFDLATAFETIYFWPGLERCFKQVHRILRDGGCFMICIESDGTDAVSLRFEKIIDGMKNYTSEEVGTALKSAGFSTVKAMHHPSKPWITVLAKK